MTPASVVTVIPNWNLKKDLGECLASLRKTTYPHHQVIVVDNGSQDGSIEFIRENYPEVEVLPLAENRGFAGALNAGIERALGQKADYVFAINNDTVIAPTAISGLIEALAGDQSIGIAAPKILYYDHPEIVFSLGDRRYRLLPVPVGFGYGKRDNPGYTGIMDFDYVTGCAMLIRTDVFRKIGLFDASYFMYYEDSDFCRRTRDAGYRIVCVADAIVYHKASLSAKKEENTITRIRARNRVRFYRRYPHGPHPWLTCLWIGLLAIWRSFGFLFQGKGGLIKPYILGLVEGGREEPGTTSYTWQHRGDA